MSEITRPPNDEQDDIEILMRVAGKRHAVSEARFDRVRTAAQSEWRQTVQRRSKRRTTIWVTASVAAAAVLVLALSVRFIPRGTPSTSEGTVRVASIVGSAWVDDGTEHRNLVAGEMLPFGRSIETSAAGRLALSLPSGHAVRLDRETRLRLLDAGSMALDQGAVYVDSGPGVDKTTVVEIHTPLGVVREVGTQFEVRLEDGAIRVRLREGAASVSHGDRSYSVRAGGELHLDSDGNVTRGKVTSYGSAWEWMTDVTPAPPLAGHTARDFLDWVARERGWTLAFADVDVARSADAIVLGGTADRLTVDEALDAVLPTCRLTYHIHDGVLTVAAE